MDVPLLESLICFQIQIADTCIRIDLSRLSHFERATVSSDEASGEGSLNFFLLGRIWILPSPIFLFFIRSSVPTGRDEIFSIFEFSYTQSSVLFIWLFIYLFFRSSVSIGETITAGKVSSNFVSCSSLCRTMDVDEILNGIGDYGRYQKFVLFMVCMPCILPSAFFSFNQLYMIDLTSSCCVKWVLRTRRECVIQFPTAACTISLFTGSSFFLGV